jgi:hypothetical protein
MMPSSPSLQAWLKTRGVVAIQVLIEPDARRRVRDMRSNVASGGA